MLPEDLNNGTGGGNDYFGRRNYHWTHGIIRYEFSSKINRKTKKLALLAMKELGDKTCIKFVPRSNQRDYGKISTVDMDCGSDIGMKRGGGRRDVELSTSCNYDKQVQITICLNTPLYLLQSNVWAHVIDGITSRAQSS